MRTTLAVDGAQFDITHSIGVQALTTLIHDIDKKIRGIYQQTVEQLPYFSEIGKDGIHFVKNRLKISFGLRKGNKSSVEKIISVMGLTNLVLLLLSIPTRLIIILAFMSAGWAAALQIVIDLLSGKGLPSLGTQNASDGAVVYLGTAYGIYHVVIISLFLLVLKKAAGVGIGTYLWAFLSIAILITYTTMGFGFSWT